jgi:ATP-dependent Lon protease
MIRNRNSTERQNKLKQIILPVLPLPEKVIFPNMTHPLLVVRERSVKALKFAIEHDSEIILITMRHPADNPGLDDLYNVGTLGKIPQWLDPKDGSLKVFVSGIVRVRILQIFKDGDFSRALVELDSEKADKDAEIQALMNNLVSSLRDFINVTKKLPPEVLDEIEDVFAQDDPALLADAVARNFSPPLSSPIIDYRVQQDILNMVDIKGRLGKVIEVLKYQTQIFGIEKDIEGRIQEQFSKQQKEYYLNEKIKAIQKELPILKN